MKAILIRIRGPKALTDYLLVSRTESDHSHLQKAVANPIEFASE